MFDPGNSFFPDTDGAIGELKAGAPTATATELSTPDTVPTALVLGSDGNLYFGWKSGIGQLDPITGAARLASLSGLTITDMTSGPDGALWFPDQNANQIGRIALDGTLFPTQGGGPAPNPGPNPGHRLASRRTHGLRLTVRSSAAKHRARVVHRSVTLH